MDIAGFRSRSTSSLMPAVSGVPPGFAVQRRHGSRKQPLSSGAKALLLLVLLGLAWLGIRRAGRKQAATAADEAATARTDGHAGTTGGAVVSSGRGAGNSGQHTAAGVHGVASLHSAKATGRSDQALLSRIERAMRLVPSYRGPGKAETWPFFGGCWRRL